jgi:hypothetical protein
MIASVFNYTHFSNPPCISLLAVGFYINGSDIKEKAIGVPIHVYEIKYYRYQ